MSRRLLTLSLLGLLCVAGCLWSSEENTGPFTIYNGPSAIVDVEVDSSRSLSGVETGTTFVYPNDRDSVQNIIVNGKLVWSDTPAFMDSLAPYYLDGRTNTVTIVWPHVSKTDTELFQDVYQVFSPLPGDTIVRADGITLRYPALYEMRGQYVTLDDGTDTIGTYLDTIGVRIIPDTMLEKLHGPWARITLDFIDSRGYFAGNNIHSTTVIGYRSIQYPMK
ncbi:MAG TPA: hypothetical protein VFH95_14630 [Candidatus Kapabacteria bacterium]|nr:hypothetical protein [Candidatus Kapabacteria bacterium]